MSKHNALNSRHTLTIFFMGALKFSFWDSRDSSILGFYPILRNCRCVFDDSSGGFRRDGGTLCWLFINTLVRSLVMIAIGFGY